MRSARGVNFVAAIATLAMSASSGAQVARLVHTGAGVARREAYHERRAQERAELEEVNDEGLLAHEQRSDVIVRVAAGTIVVEAEGPNYVPHKKRETKKQRRARQQQKAREQQQCAEAEAEAVASDTTGDSIASEVATRTGTVEASGVNERCVNGRLTNAICDAFDDEEDEGEAGVAPMPSAPPLDAHGPDLSYALRGLRRRLTEYLCEQAAKGKMVALVRTTAVRCNCITGSCVWPQAGGSVADGCPEAAERTGGYPFR